MIMIILVDVDDTVLDLNTEWIQNRYNPDYKDNLSRSQIKTWNIDEYVKPECGMKIYDYLKDKDLYSNIKPILGAVEGVKKLRELKHRVIFVTAYFNEQKVECLHRNGLLNEYPYNDERWNTATDVIMANDKSLIKGDYLIDDRIENLEKFGSGFVFNQPWNNQICNFPRFYNWDNIVNYFQWRSMNA
jgi:5'-nucleotidase